MKLKICLCLHLVASSSLYASYAALHDEETKSEIESLERQELAEKKDVEQAALDKRCSMITQILAVSSCSLEKSVTVQIIFSRLPTLNRHYTQLPQLLEETVGLARLLLPLKFGAKYGAESRIFEFRSPTNLTMEDEEKARKYFATLACKK